MRTGQEMRRGRRTRQKRYFQSARLFFSAADPMRLEILSRLAERGEACVSDMAEELNMSVAAVSHHLQILEECRCLKTVRSGRMICYQLLPNDFTRFVLGVVKKGQGL